MIRITAGKWRGQQIFSPKSSRNLPEVRPTTALMRESVFNRLQTRLQEARFLDCFAGSGIMGVEALSRGVSFVLGVEKCKDHARIIHQSLDKIGVDKSLYKLAQSDALQFFSKPNKHQPFDIAFIDPPYAFDNYERLMSSLIENKWLTDDAVIIVEYEKHKQLPERVQNKEVSVKNFGDSSLNIYQ